MDNQSEGNMAKEAQIFFFEEWLILIMVKGAPGSKMMECFIRKTLFSNTLSVRFSLRSKEARCLFLYFNYIFCSRGESRLAWCSVYRSMDTRSKRMHWVPRALRWNNALRDNSATLNTRIIIWWDAPRTDQFGGNVDHVVPCVACGLRRWWVWLKVDVVLCNHGGGDDD
nr:hypothetical protein [Tanacetum cinerariifolium]